MAKAKWLLGAALAVLGSGYYAMAQDPPAGGQTPPPPPNPGSGQTDRQNPVPENRTEVQTQTERRGVGVQVEGQVQGDRSASARPMNFHRAKQVLGSKVSIEGG